MVGRSQVVVVQCQAYEVDSVDREGLTTLSSGSSRWMNAAAGTKDVADQCFDVE